MDQVARLPAQKGTYILNLELEKPVVQTIGKLGTFNFPAGWYAYVGSALSAGGLYGRLQHHLRPVQKPHWHIDYLRKVAAVQSVWYLVGEISKEHTWAAILRGLPGAHVPAARFGASDCRCATHLVHFSTAPDFSVFQGLAGPAVQCWLVE
jgi:Uri superfamily endonuclease